MSVITNINKAPSNGNTQYTVFFDYKGLRFSVDYVPRDMRPGWRANSAVLHGPVDCPFQEPIDARLYTCSSLGMSVLRAFQTWYDEQKPLKYKLEYKTCRDGVWYFHVKKEEETYHALNHSGSWCVLWLNRSGTWIKIVGEVETGVISFCVNHLQEIR